MSEFLYLDDIMRPLIRLARANRTVIRLVCRFRRSGMSWPLTEGDTVEVWAENRMIGELPAQLVVEVLAYHLRGAQIQAEFDLSMVPPRKPLAPTVVAKQLERAKARRRRGDVAKVFVSLAALVLFALFNAAHVDSVGALFTLWEEDGAWVDY